MLSSLETDSGFSLSLSKEDDYYLLITLLGLGNYVHLSLQLSQIKLFFLKYKWMIWLKTALVFTKAVSSGSPFHVTNIHL